jgi:hypothetical protein
VGSIVSEIGQGLWFYGSQLGLVEVRKEPGPSATALPSTNPDLWPCPSASPVSRLFTPSGSGSALYGALVGGLFVLLAQLLANWAQRERDRQTERQALTGTLRAIQAEVLVLRAVPHAPMGSIKSRQTRPVPYKIMNSVKKIEKLRSQTLLFSESLKSLLQTFEMLRPGR